MRPVFDRMVRDAHQGAFDVLVVWALDRFATSNRSSISVSYQLPVHELRCDPGSCLTPPSFERAALAAMQARAVPLVPAFRAPRSADL